MKEKEVQTMPQEQQGPQVAIMKKLFSSKLDNLRKADKFLQSNNL